MKLPHIHAQRRSRWRFWARFSLWFHVVGVLGFYLVALQRTVPNKKDVVRALPPKQPDLARADPLFPLVSIIVPARNEERNIRRCLQSLLEQDYTSYEVIVVNDDSTDQTHAIIDELKATHPNQQRLQVMHLHHLPSGWAGKPHALYKGTLEARGEWLLFTDADTWHAPNSLRSMLTQALKEKADLLTLMLTQELPTFWEKVMMPMAYLGIGLQYPPRFVNDPRSPVAVANGPYILMRREVYNQIGGYRRPELRSTLLDDRDLARVVKKSGFKLRFMDSNGLVHVRMYNGFRDTWRGWRKNAFLGSRGGLGFTLLILFILPMVSVIPFLLPLLNRLFGTKRSDAETTKVVKIATALELTPLLTYHIMLNRYLRIPWYYALTHPIAGALFTGILAESTWRVLTRRGVDWRGRTYHTREEQMQEQMQTLL